MPTRREFVTAMAVGSAGASLAARPVAAQSGTDLTDWFSNTEGAGSVVDKTGRSEVTVTVGAEANGGGFGFGPPVVRIDPGTTVVWEWNGAGGSHNVVANGGAFESPLQGNQGDTFSYTFESAGVIQYYCSPHKSMGMKGAVVVGDASVTLPGGGATETPKATEDTSESDDEPRSFGGWLANTENYDGVVDRRGRDEVTVKVGAEGNGGSLAFEPAAIHVDPGTTVVWEWVGDRRYDVADPELGYGSKQVSGEGYRYAVEFGGDGLSKYECTEYGDQGMRGVVLVGDGPEETLSWQGLGTAGIVGGLLAAPLALGLRLHGKTATREGKSFGPEE